MNLNLSLGRLLAFLAFALFGIALVILLVSDKGADVEALTVGGLCSLALAHAAT